MALTNTVQYSLPRCKMDKSFRGHSLYPFTARWQQIYSRDGRIFKMAKGFPANSSQPLCSKSNLNLRIKTSPVAVGADVWFLDHTNVLNTDDSAQGVTLWQCLWDFGYIFKSKIKFYIQKLGEICSNRIWKYFNLFVSRTSEFES